MTSPASVLAPLAGAWGLVLGAVGRDLWASVVADVRAADLPVAIDPHDRAATGEVVGAADLDVVPAAARRYLERAGVVGRPRDRWFTARLRGQFWLRPNLPWMPTEAFQCNTVEPVARVFHMRIDMGGVLPMVGRDVYLGGRGTMHGTLLRLVTVAHGEGPEVDVSELTTWLNDAVLFAPSMLLVPAVDWVEIDDDRFAVTLRDRGHEVTATVTVDAPGDVVDFVTEDRWADLPGGLVRAPWRTPVPSSVSVVGRRRATGGSAIWELPEGDLEYLRLRTGPDDVRWGSPLSLPPG